MRINCQKVIQSDLEFFIGKMSFDDLRRIVSVKHRIIVDFDENDKPIYNSEYQRKLSSSRVSKIKDYILNDPEATFPNSIVLALPSFIITSEIVNNTEFSFFDIDLTRIELLNQEKPIYAQIIDGQHRFSGMVEALNEAEKIGDDSLIQKLISFEFVISFFIDPLIEFQALLFSTINRNTVTVSKDLSYDLFGLEERDSPQKTSLAICLQLNSASTDKSSPFARRIKLLGKKDNKSPDAYISQQMFIRTLLKLICRDERLAELERYKKREYFLNGGTDKTIFRKFYAEDQDNLIYKTIFNFFTAVESVFLDDNGKSYWKIGETPDNPFQRTMGFLALIDVLVVLFEKGVEEKRLNVDFFKEQLNKAKDIKLFGADGISLYPYTSKSKTQLSKDLIAMITD